MTEFEQQVEAALRDQLRFVERFDLPGDAAQFLAPRVAAAIVAAAGDAADMVRAVAAQLTGSWPDYVNTSRIYPAALAALRGER